MSNFYKNFVSLCTEHGMTPSGAASAIGLSNAAANGWKIGKEPRDTTVQKLAVLFGCSVDDFYRDADGNRQSESADDFAAAFYGGANDPELTPEENQELWDDARAYYEFKKQQMKEKKKGR